MRLAVCLFLLLVICLCILSGSALPLPSGCTEGCVTSFGNELGFATAANGAKVVGRSNCASATCVAPNSNYDDGVYTGVEWQCVEYSRRWLVRAHQITFDSIDNAYQIWDLPYFRKVSDGSPLSITKIKNGQGVAPIAERCLLIYDKDLDAGGTGHVAVVTNVTRHHKNHPHNDSTAPHGGSNNYWVDVGEQNWSNDSWEAPSLYARRISAISKGSGEGSEGSGDIFRIDDEHLIGWVCV
eukprot:gnl/Spiro4/23874_TR11817_c0_g1_i1.p1 gnl/Spiro4/23874_TR11817_c0_g1~~gnl/Spiro4/23874_TR11817_c0_g1_i1.p1  ORF type:complete len:240 (-),score=29.13 gnl/Spiro4/23874_TR11817_c0_g1_i1:12-731(-)